MCSSNDCRSTPVVGTSLFAGVGCLACFLIVGLLLSSTTRKSFRTTAQLGAAVSGLLAMTVYLSTRRKLASKLAAVESDLEGGVARELSIRVDEVIELFPETMEGSCPPGTYVAGSPENVTVGSSAGSIATRLP